MAYLFKKKVKHWNPADASLQAPPEGGVFSEAFNNITEGPGVHKFLPFFPAYNQHFAKFVGQEVHIVEIGIQSGGSIGMWRKSFGPRAHVYGIDLDPRCKIYEEGTDGMVKIFIGNQTDDALWAEVFKVVPRIDILVDDGGHQPYQIATTMGIVLPHLSPNGVYFIEDIFVGWNELALSSFTMSEPLRSPDGRTFPDLSRLVGSVHLYPHAVVLERSSGIHMVQQQLGLGGPAAVRVRTTSMLSDLERAGLDGRLLEMLPGSDISFPPGLFDIKRFDQPAIAALPVGGVLVIADGTEAFDFNSSWSERTDPFTTAAFEVFQPLYAFPGFWGFCFRDPAWECETWQHRNIASLSLYPHLYIVVRTDGKKRLIEGVSHGTQWDPFYVRPLERSTN